VIRAGSAWIDEGICWDTSEWNEYVILEYSKDNGASWTGIEVLDTTDPLFSEWTAYSIPLPQAAWGSHTQLRWRQSDNSGAGFDQWALEDMCLEGVVPNPPSPPPFIISSANSATAVAIFWAGADGATSYEIERRQGAQNWMPLASISASTTYYTDTSALPSSAYSYRVRSVNAGGTSAFSTVTTSLTWSQQEEWFSQNYGSPDAGDPEQLKNPGPDGKVPLLRFAFNLSANEPWYNYQPGKRGGAPGVWLDAANGQIHTRFIRRKAATNPGITYVVQFGDAPGHWTHSGSLVTVSTIDSIWEEVEYKDDISSNDKGTRFCRVGVQLE
jgi:hypothetical protein